MIFPCDPLDNFSPIFHHALAVITESAIYNPTRKIDYTRKLKRKKYVSLKCYFRKVMHY